MSNVKISGLPSGTSLVDTDTLPVVRSGVTTGVNTGTLVADVATLKAAGSTATLSPIQGRIQVDSTSSISLQRYQGALIPIKKSGTWQNSTIPSGGVSLSNTGLTAATLYYVYAFDSSGTLTLEAVTTTHATDSTSGVEIKSGDATRTLVGMVYMDAGSPGTFVDSTSKRYLLNWSNRSGLDLTGTFSSDRTSASVGGYAEINTEVRISFLSWADEAVGIGAEGTASHDVGGQAVATAIAIDSTSVASAESMFTTSSGGQRGPFGLYLSKRLTEGQHFATLLGGLSGFNTGTWVTTTNLSIGAVKTRLYGTTRG